MCNIDLWTFKVKTSFPLTLLSKMSKNQIFFILSKLFCEISSKWDQSMPRTRFRILREAAKKSSVTLVGARPAGWVWINYSLLVLSRIPQRAVILSWDTSHQRATSSRPCGAEKWRSTALWHPVTRLDMVHQCVEQCSELWCVVRSDVLARDGWRKSRQTRSVPHGALTVRVEEASFKDGLWGFK